MTNATKSQRSGADQPTKATASTKIVDRLAAHPKSSNNGNKKKKKKKNRDSDNEMNPSASSPPTQSAAPVMDLAQVAARMDFRFEFLHAHMEQVTIRQMNSYAKRIDDKICPMLALPALPPPGAAQQMPPVDPVPAEFPATRRELLYLSDDDYNVLLNYYGLPIDVDRCAALERFLGLPPLYY